jgi:hypothetical protein
MKRMIHEATRNHTKNTNVSPVFFFVLFSCGFV